MATKPELLDQDTSVNENDLFMKTNSEGITKTIKGNNFFSWLWNNVKNRIISDEVTLHVLDVSKDNQPVDSYAVDSVVKQFIYHVTVTTGANIQPAAEGVAGITEYKDKLQVTVFLRNGYYGAQANGMTFDINQLGAKKVFVPKDGTMNAFAGTTIDRKDGKSTQYWYAQPYTKFELEYDASLDGGFGGWVITNNPIVLSDSSATSGYTIYADGSSGYNKSQIDKITANVKGIIHTSRQIQTDGWGYALVTEKPLVAVKLPNGYGYYYGFLNGRSYIVVLAQTGSYSPIANRLINIEYWYIDN